MNQITILLNENQNKNVCHTGKISNKNADDSAKVDTEIDTVDLDDDLVSDKDKYSEWYGNSGRYNRYKDLDDIRSTNEYINGDFM